MDKIEKVFHILEKSTDENYRIKKGISLYELAKEICQLFDPKEGENLAVIGKHKKRPDLIIGGDEPKTQIILECCGKPESECRCKETLTIIPVPDTKQEREALGWHKIDSQPCPHKLDKIHCANCFFENECLARIKSEDSDNRLIHSRG